MGHAGACTERVVVVVEVVDNMVDELLREGWHVEGKRWMHCRVGAIYENLITITIIANTTATNTTIPTTKHVFERIFTDRKSVV